MTISISQEIGGGTGRSLSLVAAGGGVGGAGVRVFVGIFLVIGGFVIFAGGVFFIGAGVFSGGFAAVQRRLLVFFTGGSPSFSNRISPSCLGELMLNSLLASLYISAVSRSISVFRSEPYSFRITTEHYTVDFGAGIFKRKVKMSGIEICLEITDFTFYINTGKFFVFVNI